MRVALLLAAPALIWGCGADFVTGAGPAAEQANTCDAIGEVPPEVRDELGLDQDYYARHCSVFGIPVLGSAQAPDVSLQVTAQLAQELLAGRRDLLDAIHDRFFRIVVVATTAGEALSDVPELSDLQPQELQAAGIGPTPQYPAAAIRDSVTLCRPTSQGALVTPPGDTLVHELGHAVLSMGLRTVDPDFDSRLHGAYEQARQHGTWQLHVPDEVAALVPEPLPTDNYLMTNPDEYWAVGVSAWFGFKAIPTGYSLGDPEPNGEVSIGREVLRGRQALQARDPALTALLQEAFPDDMEVAHHCPAWLDSP